MIERRKQCATRQVVGKALLECGGDVNREDYVFLENGVSTVKVLGSSVYRAPHQFTQLATYVAVRP